MSGGAKRGLLQRNTRGTHIVSSRYYYSSSCLSWSVFLFLRLSLVVCPFTVLVFKMIILFCVIYAIPVFVSVSNSSFWSSFFSIITPSYIYIYIYDLKFCLHVKSVYICAVLAGQGEGPPIRKEKKFKSPTSFRRFTRNVSPAFSRLFYVLFPSLSPLNCPKISFCPLVFILCFLPYKFQYPPSHIFEIAQELSILYGVLLSQHSIRSTI